MKDSIYLEVVHPCWLIANGDSDRIDVARSPLVRDDDKWMGPIYQYISENGLVLAARETFDDDDWMFGEVEMSVFIGKRTESYGSRLRRLHRRRRLDVDTPLQHEAPVPPLQADAGVPAKADAEAAARHQESERDHREAVGGAGRDLC